MRRLVCTLVLAALCLSLCACYGKESPSPTPEISVTPAPTATPEPTPTPLTQSHPTDPAVFTEWSGLAVGAAPEEIYTRLTPEPMETLRPGSYGTLLTFSSENLFADGVYGWPYEVGGPFGLVTCDGMIVLDPVCSGVNRLVRYDEAGSVKPLPFLVLKKTICDPDAPDASEWNDGWVERYAVCAEDGKWCTDFVYESVHGSAIGALCVRSGENNLAECLSEQGRVVFDTKNWNVRGEIAPWSAHLFANIPADGWAPVRLESERFIFINSRGETLPMKQPVWIELAEPFSEGLAPVCVDGEWGFLDENGEMAIEPQFAGVGYGGFLGGYSIVYTNGRNRSALIDRSGNVVLEDDTIGREISDGVGWYHCFSSDSHRWYDAELNPVTISGKTPEGAWEGLGFYYGDEAGVRVLTLEGRQRFYRGAHFISVYEGYVMAFTEDECQVYDPENRQIGVFPRESWPDVLCDEITGKLYIYVSTGSGYDVYSGDGDYLLHTSGWTRPCGGRFYCTDNLTTGYKNESDEWVFRVRVDSGD